MEVSLEKLYFDIGVRIEARREETDFGVQWVETPDILN